jgi:hypothetical protein
MQRDENLRSFLSLPVMEIRDTSHKPDEIYGLIERLSPGTRKLEIFGRAHNVQKNWVTLGNQLDGSFLQPPIFFFLFVYLFFFVFVWAALGVHLLAPDMVQRFKKRYPYPIEETQKLLLTGKRSAAKDDGKM